MDQDADFRKELFQLISCTAKNLLNNLHSWQSTFWGVKREAEDSVTFDTLINSLSILEQTSLAMCCLCCVYLVYHMNFIYCLITAAIICLQEGCQRKFSSLAQCHPPKMFFLALSIQ